MVEHDEADTMVLDADGLGAGVIEHIRLRGHSARLFEFHGGAAANDANAYFNRRAEVWGSLREWLVARAEIRDDPRACINHSTIKSRAGGDLSLAEAKDLLVSRVPPSPQILSTRK
jgi:hypothetical protein